MAIVLPFIEEIYDKETEDLHEIITLGRISKGLNANYFS